MEFEFEQDPDASDDLKFHFRRLIRDALKAVDPSAQLPSIRSRSLDAWKDCLEAIADPLFWDEDFLSEETYADLDPLGSKLLKQKTGITDDYFSTPPPLVREEDYREADRYLRRAAGAQNSSTPGIERVADEPGNGTASGRYDHGRCQADYEEHRGTVAHPDTSTASVVVSLLPDARNQPVSDSLRVLLVPHQFVPEGPVLPNRSHDQEQARHGGGDQRPE